MYAGYRYQYSLVAGNKISSGTPQQSALVEEEQKF